MGARVSFAAIRYILWGCVALVAALGTAQSADAGAPVTSMPAATTAPSPDVEVIKYEDNVAHGTLRPARPEATITVRFVNHANVASKPASLQLGEVHGLWKQAGPVTVSALPPGWVSKAVVVHLVPDEHAKNFRLTDWFSQFQLFCELEFNPIVFDPHVLDPAHVYPGDPVEWALLKRTPLKQTMLKRRIFIDRNGSQILQAQQSGLQTWNLPQLLPPEICDDSICVSLNDVADSIHRQLACHVVGYAYFVGNTTSGYTGLFGSYGSARTSANPPTANFTPTTKMQIASSSKVLTTLAAIKVIGDSNLEKNAYTKFPSTWHVPDTSIVRQITYRDFVAQSSGVKQYNTGPTEGDSDLKAFFTQPIPDPNATPKCTGPTAHIPIAHPIESDKSPCYSNANFSIMRVLIPRYDGETSNDATTLADKYVSLVRDKVFNPVGAPDVACKPPSDASNLALAYKYPGVDGVDWGDLTTVCGAWGWHVSVQDYAKVLVSLNSADHKILSDCQFFDMQTNPAQHPLGWDATVDSTGTRWLEKNGADGTAKADGSPDALETTSVTIYGGKVGTKSPDGTCSPGTPGVAAVLFINSDISGSTGGADTVLLQALHDGTRPRT